MGDYHRRLFTPLILIFFVSGFSALLYQVVWQRMLGLFSGSDVRSATIIVGSYLAGLGIGSLLSGPLADRLSSRQAVQVYGICNLGIAAFAFLSRFLFYDVLFRQFTAAAQSTAFMLLIVFLSLLIPTILMGFSLPLLSRAAVHSTSDAGRKIGLLYGANTLGSGVGTLISGWYLAGTLGYEATIYLGAVLNTLVGLSAFRIARQFDSDEAAARATAFFKLRHVPRDLWTWCILVFVSGFIAISLEIIWFRVLDVAFNSNAYTYAHLLAFILVGNALGSVVGARVIHRVRSPRHDFMILIAMVALYAAVIMVVIARFVQANPGLRAGAGYLQPGVFDGAFVLTYVALPFVMIFIPNILLGFYFPLVQKAVQTDASTVAQRVGLVVVANILGNTAGSVLTGLLLLDVFGTSGVLRLIAFLGLLFVGVLLKEEGMRAVTSRQIGTAVSGLSLFALAAAFPVNAAFWKGFHSVREGQYFIVAEDSTGVAAISEWEGIGTLYAGGQSQGRLPYYDIHVLMGIVPALVHPNPEQVLIIGLGSGGTPHMAGINPRTQRIVVVEILGSELPVLQEYAQTPLGIPLKTLFEDPRYEIIVGDGRRELRLIETQFDIIQADAIYPWRSRAGMLYSQEFFEEARSKLTQNGLMAQWNPAVEVEPTFRSVFPHVIKIEMELNDGALNFLLGSNTEIQFDRAAILAQLDSPAIRQFLAQAQVNDAALRDEIASAEVEVLTGQHDTGTPMNTDLFPHSEYYLNQPLFR